MKNLNLTGPKLPNQICGMVPPTKNDTWNSITPAVQTIIRYRRDIYCIYPYKFAGPGFRLRSASGFLTAVRSTSPVRVRVLAPTQGPGYWFFHYTCSPNETPILCESHHNPVPAYIINFEKRASLPWPTSETGKSQILHQHILSAHIIWPNDISRWPWPLM